MEFIVGTFIIILIIGAFLGGDSFGGVIKSGCFGLVVIILLGAGYFWLQNTSKPKTITSDPKSEYSEFKIGQKYGGGVVAYIDSTGKHGLIAASSDQAKASWSTDWEEIRGAEGVSIGTGKQNTSDIISGCKNEGIAAGICNELILNGYNDWYLPSKDELNELYKNKAIIGGFSNNVYWSSSEYNDDFAWGQFFLTGMSGCHNKALWFGLSRHSIRAVRYF